MHAHLTADHRAGVRAVALVGEAELDALAVGPTQRGPKLLAAAPRSILVSIVRVDHKGSGHAHAQTEQLRRVHLALCGERPAGLHEHCEGRAADGLLPNIDMQRLLAALFRGVAQLIFPRPQIDRLRQHRRTMLAP